MLNRTAAMSVTKGFTKVPKAKKDTTSCYCTFKSETTGPAVKATYGPYLTGIIKSFYDLTSYLECAECSGETLIS